MAWCPGVVDGVYVVVRVAEALVGEPVAVREDAVRIAGAPGALSFPELNPWDAKNHGSAA